MNYLISRSLRWQKTRKTNTTNIDDEPKIYGVHIDGKKQKLFDRRDFIKAATAVGATIALTGCTKADEEKMAEALEKTLQAREKEGDVDEVDKKAQPSKSPTSTKTKAPTNTATEVPTETPTSTPTNTPTETNIPSPKGEVINSHSMFKGPQVNHPFIKKTTLGEEVTILGKTSDGVWFKIVDEDGVFGWCYAEFIKVTQA